MPKSAETLFVVAPEDRDRVVGGAGHVDVVAVRADADAARAVETVDGPTPSFFTSSQARRPESEASRAKTATASSVGLTT